MIFKGLKERVLKKKLDKLVSLKEETSASTLKKIQSVGILTTDEMSSKIDLQNTVASILGVKNVKIYSLRDFNKNDEVSYKHFTEKDINWRGNYVQTNIKSFLDEPLDLLIGYFNNSNMYLETAVLKSKADFKVGFSNVNSKLYHVEITSEINHYKSFIEELRKYLQILKKL